MRGEQWILFSWMTITSGVPQWPILNPALFNIFNDLDKGAECTLSKFVGDKTGRSGSIQRNLNRLDKCADRNLIKFNKGKCQVPHLKSNQSRHQYILGATQLESSLAEKGPEGPDGY